MRNNVKKITDGAMIVALLGLLIVLDGQSGLILDGLLFWFLPVLIIVYTVKYNVVDGLVVSVATTILAFILSMPHLAILVMFSNLIGLVYGHSINLKLKTSTTLLFTFIVTIFYYVITMVVFAKFFGYDLFAEINEIINFFTNLFNKNSSEIMTILKWTNPFFNMLINFIYFLPVATSAMQTIITHLVSVIILNRLELAKIQVTPFFQIQLPFLTGIITLVVLIITYVYLYINGFNNMLILAIHFIAQLIFIVMGSIYLLTYASIKRNLIYNLLTALMIIVIPIVVMIFGILDVFTNMRNNLIRRTIYER